LNRKERRARKGFTCFPWRSWPLGGSILICNRQARQVSQESPCAFFASLRFNPPSQLQMIPLISLGGELRFLNRYERGARKGIS
jgi:hypothetical protein